MSTASIQPNRLRQLREASGLRLEQVAVEFEVSRDTVLYWEQQNIPSKWLRPLASHFGVSVDFLLNGDEAAA